MCDLEMKRKIVEGNTVCDLVLKYRSGVRCMRLGGGEVVLTALCVAGGRFRHVSAVQEEVPGSQPPVRADSSHVHHPCCGKALPLPPLPLPCCPARPRVPPREDGAHTSSPRSSGCRSRHCHSGLSPTSPLG